MVAPPYLDGADLAPSVNDSLVRSELLSPGSAFTTRGALQLPSFVQRQGSPVLYIARALCLFAVLGVSRVLRAQHASVRAQLKVVRCTRCKHKSWPDPQGPSRAAPGTCSTTTASAVSLPFHTLVCCGCFTLVPKRVVALHWSPDLEV